MKKETLEEAAVFKSHHSEEDFIRGGKWQQERMYSEEEVTKLLISCKDRFGGSDLYDYTHDDEVKEWFGQFKKK